MFVTVASRVIHSFRWCDWPPCSSDCDSSCSFFRRGCVPCCWTGWDDCHCCFCSTASRNRGASGNRCLCSDRCPCSDHRTCPSNCGRSSRGSHSCRNSRGTTESKAPGSRPAAGNILRTAGHSIPARRVAGRTRSSSWEYSRAGSTGSSSWNSRNSRGNSHNWNGSSCPCHGNGRTYVNRTYTKRACSTDARNCFLGCGSCCGWGRCWNGCSTHGCCYRANCVRRRRPCWLFLLPKSRPRQQTLQTTSMTSS